MSHSYHQPEGSHHHQQQLRRDQPPPHSQAQHSQHVPRPLDQQQYQYYAPPPPPPHMYYATDDQPAEPPLGLLSNPPAGYNPPQIKHVPMSMSMSLPQRPPSYPPQFQQQQIVHSPYDHPPGMPLDSLGSSHSGVMSEYFPPVDNTTVVVGASITTSSVTPVPCMPAISPTWESTIPPPIGGGRANAAFARGGIHQGGNVGGPSGGAGGSKTSRQQFTACGACRHRRVKCDLKDKQEQAEKVAEEEGEESGVGPIRKGQGGGKQNRVSCTNCVERGLNCIDEFAPMKAAKQLRRGKRISEIEMLYGKSAASAAVAHRTSEHSSESSLSPIKGKEKEVAIPELTKQFFQSAFFRRFQVQRPIIDPVNFIERYLSCTIPCAAAMGPEGAILCHVLYAWAVSYGVDENGLLDVPEGGGAPLDDVNLLGPSESETIREGDRQRRMEKMRYVIEVVLREIDECGVLRRPTWDGVRVLLTVLPLTEGISTPVERLAMYEGAISQVFTLCSSGGMGYDGQPSAAGALNGGQDESQDLLVVRVRVYWYAFVHEGITTGLKGGRLHLDEDDLETMQDSIDHRALVRDSAAFRASSKFATAPINLALACRKINKALTGPAARRRTTVNPDLVKQAWEALEKCWEEFEDVKNEGPVGPYTQGDEITRFADGWKIFLFEAQNVIRSNLEDRISRLSAAQTSAHITDSTSSSPGSMHGDLLTVQHLLEIAKGKCEVQTRQIMAIVRRQVGSRFFEWDAGLVRDGTYYTAMLLAREGGSDEDIVSCVRALNELRWSLAKSWERSSELRREWQARSPTMIVPQSQGQSWESVLSDLARLSSQEQQNQDGQRLSTSDGQSVSTGTGSSSLSRVHQQQQHHPHPPQQHPPHQHHHQRLGHPGHQVYPGDPTSTSSSSPYTSPPIVSPNFDHNLTVQMPMMGAYVPTAASAPPHSQSHVQVHPQSFIQSQLEVVGEMDGEMEGNIDGYKWSEPPPPPLHHQHHHHHHHHHQQQHQQQQQQNQRSHPHHPHSHLHLDRATIANPASYQLYQSNDLGLGPPPLDSSDLVNRMSMGMNVGFGVGSMPPMNEHQAHGPGPGHGQYVLQPDGTHVFVPFRPV
ncbi:hypothetical protein IAR55_001551 [Kwoniella newhampshirensis]|uniref:Zn(2)-C6 fungal-type domain-containing protein n=1 Tax=Kwoniella newhampshirensis TaxID=1651941 RepID=A0AAW0Z2I9_9TREE